MFKENKIIFQNGGPEKKERVTGYEIQQEKIDETRKARKELTEEIASDLAADPEMTIERATSTEKIAAIEKQQETARKDYETNAKKQIENVNGEIKKLYVKLFQAPEKERAKIIKEIKTKLASMNGYEEILNLPPTKLATLNKQAKENKNAWLEEEGVKTAKLEPTEAQKRAAEKLLY